MEIRPKYFAFNITNRCQSHCATCNGWQTPKSFKDLELSTNDWKFILCELQEWVGNFDFIFSGGEPFLREDIFEIADYGKKIGLIPKVITNGLALKNKCEKLINSGFQDITISLNSANNPNIHNESRGLSNGFEITTDVIKKLSIYNYHSNNSKTILISSIIMPTNISELVPLAQFAQTYNVGINYQLMDMGTSFFSANICNNMSSDEFNRIKELTVIEIDKLIKMKSDGFVIYNTENQLEAFKLQIINSDINSKNNACSSKQHNFIKFKQPYTFFNQKIKDKIDIEAIKNSQIIMSEENEIKIYSDKCQIGNHNFLIDPYGDVRVCFTFQPIGSLLRNKPKDIWNSKQAYIIRNQTTLCNKSCKLLNCNYHE